MGVETGGMDSNGKRNGTCGKKEWLQKGKHVSFVQSPDSISQVFCMPQPCDENRGSRSKLLFLQHLGPLCSQILQKRKWKIKLNLPSTTSNKSWFSFPVLLGKQVELPGVWLTSWFVFFIWSSEQKHFGHIKPPSFLKSCG